MTQFRAELLRRIVETRSHLHEAEQTGDHYLAQVRLGELETLARLAVENGVPIELVDGHEVLDERTA